MKTHLARKIFILILSTVIPSSVFGDISHLVIPSAYDNIGGVNFYGQTFIAQDINITGVQVYVGDPARPSDAGVNALIGPANLLLYDATNFASPILLASDPVLTASDTASGLTTFLFNNPVATIPGTQYFFAFDTVDYFGIGMQSLFSSTYADGAEAYRNPTTGQLVLVTAGRDISFNVLSVPEPTSAALLLLGAAVGLSRRSLRTNEGNKRHFRLQKAANSVL